MEPKHSFRFCPRCGWGRSPVRKQSYFHCDACGYRLYFNAATAVACFARDPKGRVLFIRRAKEPAKGKLAVPGGFVDFGETAEEALCREMLEEVDMQISGLEYLCSYPNKYHYRGLTYWTVDVFFSAKAVSGQAVPLDEVADVFWLKPSQVKLAKLAFPSVRKAWKCWLRKTG